MNSPMPSHFSRWQAYLHNCSGLVAMTEPTQLSGRITRVAGLVMEAVGLKLPVGSPCTVPLPNGTLIEAEVVGFQDERLFLMPQSDVEGIVPGTRVYPVEPVKPPPRTGPIAYIRRNRKPLTQEFINTSIAGRDYQIRAIRAVLEGIEQLSPRQKLIFRMSRIEGLSHEEIADRLQLSKNTVKVHMVIALNFMRTWLKDRLQ